MDEIIEAERDSEVDNHFKPPQKWKRKLKQKGKATELDKCDDNFVTSSSSDDSEPSSSEDDCVEITNEEVCYLVIKHLSWILHIIL